LHATNLPTTPDRPQPPEPGVILEIEAEASKTVRAMPGLIELMETLRDHDVRGGVWMI
jgi:hypothetical protein